MSPKVSQGTEEFTTHALEEHRKLMKTSPVYAERVMVIDDFAKAIRIIFALETELKRYGWSQNPEFNLANVKPATIGALLSYSVFNKGDKGQRGSKQRFIAEYYLNKALSDGNYSFETYSEFDGQDVKLTKVGVTANTKRAEKIVSLARLAILKDLDLGPKRKIQMFYE